MRRKIRLGEERNVENLKKVQKRIVEKGEKY